MSLLFAYYGDDFTGSTDALESLAANGIRTVLFLGVPSDRHFQQFAGYQAIGVAGESRSRSPEWMYAVLPGVFAWIKNLNAPLVQYKVCSTFDSSPHTGNISVAMRIGREVFETRTVPVVVAAPHLQRFVLFGNLFAKAADAIYRIDRHPTMSRHPVTPMHESDLRLHLKALGESKPELLDLLHLDDESLDQLLKREPSAIIFDGLDERSELATGKLLWERRATHPFTVGSAGLTRSLFRQTITSAEPSRARKQAVSSPLIVVSGSCSPITESQIQHAQSIGFETLPIASDDLLRRGLAALARDRSLVVYSALGSNERHGSLAGEDLGRQLGSLLRALVQQSGVRRAIIAGGDTSSHAMSELGIHALTFAGTLAPGAPLCRAHSDDPSMHGLELVLKGGQVGGVDFFERVRTGQI